ncbi:MAG: alpha/beta hydrolase [Pseudomonadota bacterium]
MVRAIGFAGIGMLFLMSIGCAAATDTGESVDATAAETPAETPIVFEASSGKAANAFAGTFRVPENHDDPESRTLTLHYVRFPATGENPGAPIVYLAGGPGGSGIATAKWRRFPLFMAMREFGDVIALDQRGTGASNDLLKCTSPIEADEAKPLTDDAYIERHQRALKWCLNHWRAQSFDLEGYTTVQSVADLKALRTHLGAEKLTLWGTSYGSHLALAAVKEMGDEINRLVLSSVEGLDQTIKRPARTDAYFARLQAAIDKDPALRETYPDIVALMERVHDALDKSPIRVSLNLRNGEEADILIQSRTLRRYMSGLISDPRSALQMLAVYEGLDNEDTGPVVSLMERWHEPEDTISFRLMPTVMDVASGITARRRLQIEREAKTAVLRSFLNFTLHYFDVAPELDLGDGFRKKPASDIPLLVLSGTLDGRTYLKSQREATSGFSNRQSVIVENAGHNLFMASPDITKTIEDFMRGDNVDGRGIAIDFPGER